MSLTILRVPAELADRSRCVTAEFQEILDRARDAQGARVVVPAGTYRVGSIRMYGDTELYLEAGATIRGSDEIADYTDWDIPTTLRYATDPEIVRIQRLPPHYTRALLTVADAQNVTIVGEPGSFFDGVDCTDPAGEEGFRGAMGIRICRCRNVTLKGYTFVRSANWSHQIDSCDNVFIERVSILGGHDGLNIHHCNNVTIRSCTLKTGDDCVAGFDARNVVVEDCLLNTACNAIRLGCINLLVDSCRFVGPGEYEHILEGTHHMHAEVKYYSPAGDVYRGDSCSWRLHNCSFVNPGRLINYDFGSEKGYQTERPLVDMHFEGCKAQGVTMSSFFNGNEAVPGLLEFNDCQISYEPDVMNAGKPFVQMSDNSSLLEKDVVYECATSELFRGARCAERSEVVAEVLYKKQK